MDLDIGKKKKAQKKKPELKISKNFHETKKKVSSI